MNLTKLLLLTILTIISIPADAHRKHRVHGNSLSATFYENDGISANGYTYSQNDRKYGYCVATNRYPLGTVLELPSRGGYIRAVNVDRIGHGSELDLHINLARRVFGNLSRGRMSIPVRVVGHVNCLRRHQRHSRK